MLKVSRSNERSYELAEEVVRDYVQRTHGAFGIIVNRGMCADWAIHDSENDKGRCNLHIHVLLTIRPITENGERIPVIDKRQDSRKLTSVTANSEIATPHKAGQKNSF